MNSFKGGSSEIKLDSDDDDAKEETRNKDASGFRSTSRGAAPTEVKPQLSVSETITSKTKVAAPSLISDEVSLGVSVHKFFYGLFCNVSQLVQ